MAEAGKIYHEHTSIEISEDGVIWLVQNHIESDSVIIEMESSSKGKYIDDNLIDDGYLYADDYDEDMFGEDYL